MIKETISKIIVIGTYFGRWPAWFPAFMLSCAKNQTINWLFFTDCEIPHISYPNIRFEQISLAHLNDLASSKLGLCIEKGAYSQADLQPAYGLIFEEYIKGFDFWGHCDIDLVWGNIRHFATEDILQNYEIVSFRKGFLAGHLTLWRNKAQVNTLFTGVPAYRDIFSCKEYHNFDEFIISTFLKTPIVTGGCKIRVYWPENLVAWFHGNHTPIGWYWDHGRIFDEKHREYVYLHFQSWKKSVTTIDFQVGDQPQKFRFTPSGVQSRLSMRDLMIEKLNSVRTKGAISGFFIKSQLLLRLLKRLWLIRNIYWAKKLAANQISAKDIRYEPQDGDLLLKAFDLRIGKKQSYLLDGYYAALKLIDEPGARFLNDTDDRLLVKIAGLRFAIHNAGEIFSLKELFVDGKYNMLFSRPVVVLDIGMTTGLSSIYFAAQSDVVVLGYEPCQEDYNQALYNRSLNPAIAQRMRAIKASIGDAEFRTIAHFYPERTNHRTCFSPNREEFRTGPKFEYEEVQIEDVSKVVDTIVTDYPGRDVILKINFKHPRYHIDGISEEHLINRLAKTGKLDFIEAIMLEWHRPSLDHNSPAIARQLSDHGFKVLLFSPFDAYEGKLYAVRNRIPGPKEIQSQYEAKTI